MDNGDKCPVCFNAGGGTCKRKDAPYNDYSIFNCDVCGRFKISRMALVDLGPPEKPTLAPIERAALSHRLRTAQGESEPPLITTDWLNRFRENSRLPSPAVQATNIIRYIGDQELRTGAPIQELPVAFQAIVGAPNRAFAMSLGNELIANGMLNGTADVVRGGRVEIRNVKLTLRGWERYESEREGKFAGRYGFIAMKFNDPILDNLVEEVIKPVLRNSIDYTLVHMRDVAQAGIIDNIMRAQIRDSAFVLVDLTHDNSGAYWEAGYAEGLGKPVVYICERSKFDDAKTHFDTNHCTTVLWSVDDHERFEKELVATLRRSLNLFPMKDEETRSL